MSCSFLVIPSSLSFPFLFCFPPALLLSPSFTLYLVVIPYFCFRICTALNSWGRIYTTIHTHMLTHTTINTQTYTHPNKYTHTSIWKPTYPCKHVSTFCSLSTHANQCWRATSKLQLVKLKYSSNLKQLRWHLEKPAKISTLFCNVEVCNCLWMCETYSSLCTRDELVEE